MTQARKNLISPSDTPFYHCMTRCVRRAYLCGNDPLTGKNFDHRKQWTVLRLKQLASVFCIDICAYAVMSNHYHVVLHINEAKAKQLADREVAERWCAIFNGPLSIQKWLCGDSLHDGDRSVIEAKVVEWRKRLTDISWFMRCMNESIARQANKEDDCKGRFWEGRFNSQALLDETAILACMTYVDLNPVRANIADDLQNSDFTSIQTRLHEHLSSYSDNTKANKAKQRIQQRLDRQAALTQEIFDELPQSHLPEAELMPFGGSCHTAIHHAIPFSLQDYLQLIDETGRIIRDDKNGFLENDRPPLLRQFGIEAEKWITSVKAYGSMFSVVAGNKRSMRQHLMKTEKRWIKGEAGAFG